MPGISHSGHQPPNPRSAPPRANRRPKWTESLLITRNGISIQAKSTGASFRGTRVGPHRPDLIICDDLEKDEHVQSPQRRARLDAWLRRVVIPALAPGGRIVVLGSLIHHDSLLANLRDPQRYPGWDYRVYRALNPSPDSAPDALHSHTTHPPAADASPSVASDPPSAPHSPPAPVRLQALWPARWPVERLEAERARIGTLAFEQEYQANPVDDALRVFRPEWLRRYDPRTLDARNLTTILAIDPAAGSDAGDFFALWAGSIDHETGTIYTRELSLARVGIVDQVRLIRAAHLRWRPLKIGIEVTAYQVVLRQILDELGRREGEYFPIVPIHSSANKRARIEGSAPFFENGTLLFPPDLDPVAEAQFLQFPRARHDDAPDVCAMGIELARTVQRALRVEVLTAPRTDFRDWRLW
ncbi:MAG: hypothetical protein IPM64_00930 [Phycisphaerales bacterium]|nr:hypothetical protein [Phycisphaerales bacterium]